MSDLINRQDAINIIKGKVFHAYTDEFYGVMRVLNELPSAESKRKHGEWIDDGDQRWHCSVCKVSETVPVATSLITEISYPQWIFCPNCGAKMDGDINELDLV